MQSSARVSEVTDTARSQGTETPGTPGHILIHSRHQGPETLHLRKYSLRHKFFLKVLVETCLRMIGLLEEGREAGSLPRKCSLGPALPRKFLLGSDLPKKSSLEPVLPKKSSLPVVLASSTGPVLTSYRKFEDLDLGDQVDSAR